MLVTLAPVAFLVQQIAGDRLDVVTMVGANQNAEHYQPQPRQLADADRAAIYFSLGMPFESVWLPKLTGLLPDVKIVTLHPAGDDGDPHRWTDPQQAIVMSDIIHAELVQLLPAARARLDENHAILVASLTALDNSISLLMAEQERRRFLVYHPAWSHFAARYGLQQVAVEHDGKEPGARSLAGLRELVATGGGRFMLVQPQSSAEHARRFAADLGVELVTVDPLNGDYINNLRQAAQAIAGVLW
ncbi:MAG: zinc ABC transporter substrate-binding protein [Gammaproteobacteria bacterium]|nr:zinc ABC transporter substrate-binding protein [Gammaproteobacteria bacterium]